jgi:hypothetical protein
MSFCENKKNILNSREAFLDKMIKKIDFKTSFPNKQKKLKWSDKVVLWNHL